MIRTIYESVLTAGLIAGYLLLAPSSGRAELLAYDGFAYPNIGMNLVGQTDSGPGASFGWDNTVSPTWMEATTTASETNPHGILYQHIATSLSYAKNSVALATNGGYVQRSTVTEPVKEWGTALPWRNLATPLGGTGSLAETQTVWTSFLIQDVFDDSFPTTSDPMGPTGETAPTFVVLPSSDPANNDIGTGGPPSTGGGFLGGTTTFRGDFVKHGIGGAGRGNLQVDPRESDVPSLGTGARFYDNTGLDTTNDYNLGVNDVHLIVTRIIFGGGDDTSLARTDSWLDPTPGLNPLTDPWYTANPGHHTQFTNDRGNWDFVGITVRSSGAVNGPINFDEIRIGTDWSDVIPVASTPAHPGDFDGDGDVDGADFVAWQTHFPTAMGATLADGDADGDGDVDGADFVVWQTNFPFTPGSGATPVPEPAAGWLLSFGVALVLAGARNRAKR